MCHSVHLEIRGEPCKVSSFLHLYLDLGNLNSSSKALLQGPFLLSHLAGPKLDFVETVSLCVLD